MNAFGILVLIVFFICLYIVYQMDGKVLIMTKQEALAELKDCVRCAEWVDEDSVDCVSTEALKVAIEALEREVSMYRWLDKIAENITRSYESSEVVALLRTEEVKAIVKKHFATLESIDRHLIQNREESTEVGMELVNDFQKEAMLRLLKYAGYDCEVLNELDDFVMMRVSRKSN